MLKQGSVYDLKSGVLKRSMGYIVVTMRFYPRFLRKELRDEFISDLAPTKELLEDFNAAQKLSGDHNRAFADVEYEQRFELSSSAMSRLKQLALASHKKDVYLICICASGERCHREMLLLLAHKIYGCKVDKVFHEYPDFMARLSEFSRYRPAY